MDERKRIQKAHTPTGWREVVSQADVDIRNLCHDLDTADAEIAQLTKAYRLVEFFRQNYRKELGEAKSEIVALKAQMSSMVTLEQVECALIGEWQAATGCLPGYEGIDEGEWRRFIEAVFDHLQEPSQSTPTDAVKPAKRSVQYAAQQIRDAIHDHCKYILSIGRTDDPDDLADEVMDLLAVRSQSTPTKQKETPSCGP